MTDTSQTIDPHRPWIRDERDDPSQMNWVQTLFNPFGMTGKLHFSRAWTFMFMGRVLLFFGPLFSVFLAGLAGANTGGAWKPLEFFPLPIPALLVPFFVFTIITELTSWVAHVRRFAEANRSTLKAMIVLIPLALGLAGFAAGVSMGASQFEVQRLAAEKAAEKTQQAESEDESAKDESEAAAGDGEADAEGSETEAAEEAAAPAASQQQARQGQQGGQQRQGPPPTQREMAMGAGLGIAQLLWALSSFVVMLWTLLYVARLPNGGVGQFRTGSDLSMEEQRQLSY